MKHKTTTIALILFVFVLAGCTETGTVTQKTTPPPLDSLLVIPESKPEAKKTEIELPLIPEKTATAKQPESFPEPQEFVTETETEKTVEVAPEPKPQVAEIKEVPPPPVTGKFSIQLGAFKTEAAAKQCIDLAVKKFKKQFTFSKPAPGSSFYLVRTATVFTDKQTAEQVRNIIILEKEFKDAWIVTLK